MPRNSRTPRANPRSQALRGRERSPSPPTRSAPRQWRGQSASTSAPNKTSPAAIPDDKSSIRCRTAPRARCCTAAMERGCPRDVFPGQPGQRRRSPEVHVFQIREEPLLQQTHPLEKLPPEKPSPSRRGNRSFSPRRTTGRPACRDPNATTCRRDTPRRPRRRCGVGRRSRASFR